MPHEVLYTCDLCHMLGILHSFSLRWPSQGLSQMAKKKTTTMTMPRRGPNKVANREDSALVVATVACLPASWSPHPHPHPHAHPHSHPRPHLYPHADRRRGAAMNWELMRMPSDHLKRIRRQEAGEDVAGCARMG